MSNRPNPLLASIEANHQEHLRLARMATRQLCEDICVITLNECFDMEGEDVEKFLSTMDSLFLEWAVLLHDDHKVDQDLEYSTEKVEERLRQIRGKNYVPREKRYYYLNFERKKKR